MSHLPQTGESETAHFIATLREVFQGEKWEEIRHYAERAWVQCELAEGKTWDEIESFVREAWHESD